jgi:hypothetical protein
MCVNGTQITDGLRCWSLRSRVLHLNDSRRRTRLRFAVVFATGQYRASSYGRGRRRLVAGGGAARPRQFGSRRLECHRWGGQAEKKNTASDHAKIDNRWSSAAAATNVQVIVVGLRRRGGDVDSARLVSDWPRRFGRSGAGARHRGKRGTLPVGNRRRGRHASRLGRSARNAAQRAGRFAVARLFGR